MSSKTTLKDLFEAETRYGPFFTTGRIEWISNGDEIVCQETNKLNIFNITLGKVTSSICESNPEDEFNAEDTLYSFTISHDNLSIVTAHKSGLLKLWNKNDGSLVKMWRNLHNGPVLRLVFNANSSVIASGGSDSFIRLWSYDHKICLASLKGSLGVVNVVEFHPDLNKKIVIAAGDDNKINGWNYEERELIFSLIGHFSKITSLCISKNHKYLLSTSRDKVVILWDFENYTQIKTIPIYESIECGIILNFGTILPNGYICKLDNVYIAVGGTKGIIQVWEMLKGRLVYTQTNSLIAPVDDSEEGVITQLLFNETYSQLAITTADHNILIHDISNFNCAHQIVGHHDEILDIVFVGKDDIYLALATNSKDIKLYDTTTMNCKLMKGHTDIVLALSAFENLILSSSKDNTIRLWKIDFLNLTVNCIGIGARHTASVGSVDFGNLSHSLCVSVSQDTCLKVWKIPKNLPINEVVDLNCVVTQIAHEKDVNCVTISPNDRLIATASQDKTAKLWDVNDLSLVGVFRGHRRGVWCVRFSPIDQVLLTTAADATIKLWSLSDTTCIKTFEGHEGSVLRGEFISNGLQILTASSDGILKVWSIKTSDCCTTFEHDCKIWAIAITKNEKYLYSGGSDSQLIKWKDVSEESRTKKFQEQQDNILQEQELNNLVNDRKLLKALKYTLQLERPLLTLKIITNVINSKEEKGLEETIANLKDLHKEKLFQHASTWNTNSRNCRPAQLVINILLKDILSGKFQPIGLQKHVEHLIPYTERHFNRVTEFVKDLKYLEYTMKCMQPTFNGTIDNKI